MRVLILCILCLAFTRYLKDDDATDDEHGDVLDRETIKKHTNQMLNARLKAKQPKKSKKKKVMSINSAYSFFYSFPQVKDDEDE
jgi:hypothetical protein